MMSRSWIAVLVLAVVAAGCNGGGTGATGDGDDDAADGDGGGGEATSVTVQVDGQADDYNSSFLAYFPDEVTVHPGDTVVYESVFTGEPHTITFGTAVQDVVEQFEALPPEALEEEGPPPPELEAAFERIPSMLPEGPGDAHQNSVNPCFVAAGEEIPEDTESPCPVTEPEPFTGTETFYNSGFLADGERFELQLADDIEPGTYKGFCTLHFVEMISTVNVVAEDEEVPPADEVEEEGQAQLQEAAGALAPAVEAAADDVPEGEVAAGITDEEAAPGALANEFVPADMQVSAGEPVTWNINGPHTVSFNAPEDVRVPLARGDDGYYHLNPESLAPAGFDAPPPPEGPEGEGEPGSEEGGEEGPPEGEGPPEEEGPPEPVDAGEWDGTGFLSSGIMFFGPFSVTITEPGTYEYICLIHPDMEGTVNVN